MRRMVVGLAAAALAGVVGFGGAAQAGATYVTLTPGNTLATSGGVSWYVNDCIYNGGGCSNLVMSPNGSGITISAAPARGRTVRSGSAGCDRFHRGSLRVYRFFSWGRACYPLLRVGEFGRRYRWRDRGHNAQQWPSRHDRLAGNGSYPDYLSLTASNYVDVPWRCAADDYPTSVSVGAPVPEPASFGLMAFALLAVAAIRFRPVR